MDQMYILSLKLLVYSNCVSLLYLAKTIDLKCLKNSNYYQYDLKIVHSLQIDQMKKKKKLDKG